MAKSDQLRVTRLGTIINTASSKQESEIIRAITQALAILEDEYSYSFHWKRNITLAYIMEDLRKKRYKDIDPNIVFPTSSMRPDGGIVSLLDEEGTSYPILIAEVKNQGTNNKRLAEGLENQAQGNAIERLGKNVIGLRTWLLTEDIFPFICFGYGCDFAVGSSILDRVRTINQFGELNTFAVDRSGINGEMQRGCFYFREDKWTVEEMEDLVLAVMVHSINYYQKKYTTKEFQ